MKANELGISPAPWSYDDNREGHEGLCTVFDADGKVLMCFGDMEDCEWNSIADGRFVGAAPDLYDALLALCDAADDPHSTFDVLVKAVAVGRAAIEKARA